MFSFCCFLFVDFTIDRSIDRVNIHYYMKMFISQSMTRDEIDSTLFFQGKEEEEH